MASKSQLSDKDALEHTGIVAYELFHKYKRCLILVFNNVHAEPGLSELHGKFMCASVQPELISLRLSTKYCF